jgi:hypothetical protein
VSNTTDCGHFFSQTNKSPPGKCHRPNDKEQSNSSVAVSTDYPDNHFPLRLMQWKE